MFLNSLKRNGGSVCESNAPVTSKMPPTGFEDRGHHQMTNASVALLSMLGTESLPSNRPAVLIAAKVAPEIITRHSGIGTKTAPRSVSSLRILQMCNNLHNAWALFDLDRLVRYRKNGYRRSLFPGSERCLVRWHLSPKVAGDAFYFFTLEPATSGSPFLADCPRDNRPAWAGLDLCVQSQVATKEP